MNPNHQPIRILGQRSIPMAFLSQASKRSTDSREKLETKASNTEYSISVSDLLLRSLHRSSVLPKSVQGNERPLQLPDLSVEVDRPKKGEFGVKKMGKAELMVLDDGILQNFKPIRKEKEDSVGSCANIESSTTCFIQEQRKRKNPFEGWSEKKPPRLVVIGEDPNPIQNLKKGFTSNKRPRTIFNHYGNGGGWWDSNMEGVDNEEVGCSEQWEGVGSTSLGGLEWH